MILYIRFLREAHENSSRPVAYLKGARQERSKRQLKARKMIRVLYSSYALNEKEITKERRVSAARG